MNDVEMLQESVNKTEGSVSLVGDGPAIENGGGLDSQILPLIDLMQAVNGLDESQARILTYFAIATYGLPELQVFPLLVISGAAGTGKTTLLEVLQRITYKPCPQLIDGKSSSAILRDALDGLPTALIDEADEASEKWLFKRYSRQSSNLATNSQYSQGPRQGEVWNKKNHDMFGATVLHRRKPFKDPAILSRSIAVYTKRANVDVYVPGEFEGFNETLAGIASQVDWKQVSMIGNNRISDTWAPLLAVDSLFSGDWKQYAESQMEMARKNLDLGHETEPSQAVYKSLLALVLDEHGNVSERVLMGAVAKNLDEEEALSPYQVGVVLIGLGFEKRSRGGKTYIYTGGEANLADIGLKLGLKDDWLDDIVISRALKPGE